MKNYYRISVFSLLLIYLLSLVGCVASVESSSISDDDIKQLPDGWYESPEDSEQIIVFLSKTQGDWKIGEYDRALISVTSAQSTQEAYACFYIEANSFSTSPTVNFICQTNDQIISTCSLSLYINESALISVTGGNLSSRPQPTPVDDTIPTNPYIFALNYHRVSSLLIEAVGESVIDNAHRVIDAFLAHQTQASLQISDNVYQHLEKLGFALERMCPPFYALTTVDYHKGFNNGILKWTYSHDATDTAALLNAFSDKVGSFMGCLDRKDCDTAKAMLLYHQLTQNAVYDYDICNKENLTAEESRLPMSPYTAILNGSGVCSSYAAALSFLYTQVGIDCVSVNGNAPDSYHQWVLFQLNEEYYYADPTYDLGGGFKFFGLSQQDRCSAWGGNFQDDSFVLCLESIPDAYIPSSTRFSALHNALEPGNADFQFHHSSQTAKFCYGAYSFSCDI